MELDETLPANRKEVRNLLQKAQPNIELRATRMKAKPQNSISLVIQLVLHHLLKKKKKTITVWIHILEFKVSPIVERGAKTARKKNSCAKNWTCWAQIWRTTFPSFVQFFQRSSKTGFCFSFKQQRPAIRGQAMDHNQMKLRHI